MSEALALDKKVKNYEFVLVSDSSVFDSRIDAASSAFGYSFTKTNIKELTKDEAEPITTPFVILDASLAQNQNEAVGFLQGVRFVFPESFILVVFPKRFDKDIVQWIRKSGANLIMSETEFLETSRFDFFLSQTVGTEYMAVKHGDLKENSVMEIPLFYFMSANRRYFPIVPAQTVLDESRLTKVKKIGDVYIRRSDLEQYNRYLTENEELSAKGIIRRCRVQFNQFRQSYLELVVHLTEEAEVSSYEDGKRRMDVCQKISGELVMAVMSAGSIFDVISQAVDGEFNSADRAPERAAIIGYLCVMSGVGNSDAAILACLLSDVGMLNLSPACLHAIRKNGLNGLSAEMRREYENHPQMSLNCAAQQRLQLTPEVREAILHSHARIDGTGFPRVRSDKISVEAQLVHFVQILDERCQVRYGKPRINFMDELKALIKDTDTLGLLSPVIVRALKEI